MLDYIAGLLTGLLDIDTRCGVAPELPAAQFLHTRLSEVGAVCAIYEPVPGRGSVTAVIPGAETSRIVLHAHLDTADVDATKWQYPPLRATMSDGRIYGRGALDCKGLCAVWTGICGYFMKNRLKPQKTIVFTATADEESGGFLGTKWLCDNTGIFDRADLVIGEGGGFAVEANGQDYFAIQTGEQSQPGYCNQASLDYMSAPRYGKRRVDPAAFSAAPEGYTENCKMADIIRQIQQTLRRMDRNEVLLPFSAPGFSDNRHFRELGIPTIGFFPIGMDNSIAGIHGPDEYINMRSLKMAYEILLEIVLDYSMPK